MKITQQTERFTSHHFDIEARGVIFVIPNSATARSDLMDCPCWGRGVVDKFFDDNNLKTYGDVTNRDKAIIQCWIHSSDLNPEESGCDNLGAHGFSLTHEGTEYSFPSSSTAIPFGNIPYALIKNAKEGDEIVYKRTIQRRRSRGSNDPYECTATITLTLRCEQQGHRYQSHGQFEDVVEKVMRNIRD